MITPEIKDLLLSDLVSEPSMECTLDINKSAKRYGISQIQCDAIIRQFEKLGFIHVLKSYDGYEVNITVDAHDFMQRGGFTGQEMLLKANIEKLGLEIDKLSKDLLPKQLETAGRIATIGSAILSSLKLFG